MEPKTISSVTVVAANTDYWPRYPFEWPVKLCVTVMSYSANMQKTILITGATDGIGKMTAQKLAAYGNTVLVHGRNSAKLEKVAKDLAEETNADVYSYLADLSDLIQVRALADQVRSEHKNVDVVINNAGVLAAPVDSVGLDLRFVVNTLAPVVLTERLFSHIPADGRIVNVLSAAQSAIEVDVLTGRTASPSDMTTYAQSKLALGIWAQEKAKAHPNGPVMVSLNPGSYLASKMVTEVLGMKGNDLSIGANVLCDAALSKEFGKETGRYFDNDTGLFTQLNLAAADREHVALVMALIEAHTI